MTKVNILSPVKYITIVIKKFHLDSDMNKLVNDILVNCNIYSVVLAIKRYVTIVKIPIEKVCRVLQLLKQKLHDYIGGFFYYFFINNEDHFFNIC